MHAHHGARAPNTRTPESGCIPTQRQHWHPRPSHLGHLPSGCPRHPWGAPAHMCQASWPSRRPGSPCPESPSFLSQSGRDSRRPHPKREKSRGQGGAAPDLAGHGGRKRLHQADTSACRRNCRFLPAAQNSRHILQAASPTLPMTKTAAPPPTAGHPAFRKPGIHESKEPLRVLSRVRVHQTWGPGGEDAELGGESVTDAKGRGSGVPPAFPQSLMHPS